MAANVAEDSVGGRSLEELSTVQRSQSSAAATTGPPAALSNRVSLVGALLSFTAPTTFALSSYLFCCYTRAASLHLRRIRAALSELSSLAGCRHRFPEPNSSPCRVFPALEAEVVTCGNVPLESSFRKVPRCVYTSTSLFEYRSWDLKAANPSHRRFTWGLRSLEVLRDSDASLGGVVVLPSWLFFGWFIF